MFSKRFYLNWPGVEPTKYDYSIDLPLPTGITSTIKIKRHPFGQEKRIKRDIPRQPKPSNFNEF